MAALASIEWFGAGALNGSFLPKLLKTIRVSGVHKSE